METNSWSQFLSKRHQSTLQSRFGFDELDGGDDESRTEFLCPFCNEEFDILGLCFHIDDDHPVEARNGICPVCADRVGVDLVGHITMQHASYFKMQRRRRLRKGSTGTHSIPSLMKSEYRQGNLHSFLGGSCSAPVSASAVPDPLLSSFIFTMPVADSSKDVLAESLDESSATYKSSDDNLVESVELSMSDQNQQEKAQRSEFVRELVLSTIFEDIMSASL
ncbi:protein DEHYDRATION-INDUCED 19 homolog 2-like isoform X1 [Dioscorea cayenensis subsp. rotundata]|uniref:Protein DEHYDRATION-INDUCED 19 homolog 2-like isoform X1 n=1 Tax=Dioscorea cayennensis subsp. rotundata TaxID=55577 RepID=A0AB40BHM3_DIOCR|nr:protein DEHYDRATION-INDUCED 19 homolog 2-like isoform X1 [Dioscorea cayenensis subsp. rotundata]